MTEAEISRWNAELRQKSPLEIVRWAVGEGKGRAIVSTNFRPYEAALLHVVTQVQPDMPVLWVDHGYNRPATYKHAEALRSQLLGLLTQNAAAFVRVLDAKVKKEQPAAPAA